MNNLTGSAMTGHLVLLVHLALVPLDLHQSEQHLESLRGADLEAIEIEICDGVAHARGHLLGGDNFPLQAAASHPLIKEQGNGG